MPQIQLLSAATATNGAPSAATDGVALPHLTDRSLLFLHSTAGSGTMTVTCKLWGYNGTLAKWYPLGTHATAATKGIINAGNAIDATAANTLRHCEEVTSLRRLTRVYLEITAIGGTETAVSAFLDPIGASAISES